MIQNPDYDSSYLKNFEGEESHLLVIFSNKEAWTCDNSLLCIHMLHIWKYKCITFSNDFEEQGFFFCFWIIIAIAVRSTNQLILHVEKSKDLEDARVATISSGDAGPADDEEEIKPTRKCA